MSRLAALSSGLLARKGQARPAMRPQGYAEHGIVDDLGWNDMGEAPLPPVLVEREQLAAEVESPEAEAAPETRRPVSVATAARIQRETDHKGKAAFTLRLDADRHLRLRLAGAIADRSAQTLMTEALDAFLETMPEVATLVAQLPPAKRRQGSSR